MAEDWLGVPFRMHGRDKSGCDCIGLIIGILHENNIISNDDFIRLNKIRYGTNLSKITDDVLHKEILRFFRPTQFLNKADILIMKTKNSPLHFAIHRYNIQNNGNEIIHASNEVKMVCKINLDNQLYTISEFYYLEIKNF